MSDNIYLNWGTLAKTWPTVLEASFRHQREYENNPTVSLFEGWGRLWLLQEKVAQFFKARPQDFYFRPNVTVAMNDFILGADLPEGDIVVSDLEYGSIVNICKMRASRDNRNLTTLQIPMGGVLQSDEHLVELIMAQLPQNTSMLLLSHIMTGNGLKIPLKLLAKKTRDKNIFLVIDGAHGPGATDLNFSELGDVDFYGGNLHKWFRGPKGTGFGWAPERNHVFIKPLLGSWTIFETPKPFVPFGDGDRWNISMLMSYCLNFGNFYALSEAVDEWQKLGAADVYRVLQAKRDCIEIEMKKFFNWNVLSASCTSLQSPLVTFELPQSFAARGYEIMHELQKTKNVTVSVAPLKMTYALRLSVHMDTPDGEISEGVGRLRDYFNFRK